jgi:16S rRNA (cytosine1402-N4)-methyltransferase
MLELRDGLNYCDVTLGLSGHVRWFAEQCPGARFIGSDADGEALDIARERCAALGDRIRFTQGLFDTLPERLERMGELPLRGGIFADLGQSMMQIQNLQRGFSFHSTDSLSMKFDPNAEGPDARQILNTWSEAQLADVFFHEGEERFSRRISREVRAARPFHSTQQFSELVERVVPRKPGSKIRTSTKCLMALRRVVNREREQLQSLFDSLPVLLAPGARAVLLTYMSIEDRHSKNALRDYAKAGRCRLLNKHVVTATSEEIAENAPSRSAKLRAVEWIA